MLWRQRLGLWLCWLCLCHQLVAAAPPRYEPRRWNRSCNHTVRNVPAAEFFRPGSSASGGSGNGSVGGNSSSSSSSAGNRNSSSSSGTSTRAIVGPLFPVSPGYRAAVRNGAGAGSSSQQQAPVQAVCFGPGEAVNQTLVAAGLKMPCGYAVRPGGVVDYWEEAVCRPTLQANCYCYALDRQSTRGYCIPGYAASQSTTVDTSSCADGVAKVTSDGGRPVTRAEVYAAQQPAEGHFIALAVWLDRDFHFFRRDADGAWSTKRGDTFATNTVPNGSLVTDVEDAAVLGAYRFCAYFHVLPHSHAASDSNWTYSSVPQRLAEAAARGYDVASTPLPQPSAGWMRLNYPYLVFGLDAAFFESTRQLAWQEDASTAAAAVDEAGTRGQPHRSGGSGGSGGRLQPHWTSVAQPATTQEERDQATVAHYAQRGALQRGPARV